MKLEHCECLNPNPKEFLESEIQTNGFFFGWCTHCKKPIEQEQAKKLFPISDERSRLPREAANLIPESEKVKFSVKCDLKSKPKDKSGYAVITDRNIYLIGSVPKFFGKANPLTKEVLQLGHITGLDQTLENYLTIKSYHVRITRANNEDTLYGLSHASATAFIDAANELIHKSSGTRDNQSDPIEQLTKLAALLEKGLISQEEFNKKKQDLL